MTTPRETLEWLLETGGPVVRWLTLTSLTPDPDPEVVDAAREALLAAPHVRLWLDRLAGVTQFHDSGNNCFENVAGKLAEFGLREGMGDLDKRLAPFRDWIANHERGKDRGMMAELNRVLCLAHLLRLGYKDDALREHALARLETIHRVAESGRFDVLLPEDPPDLPKAYRGRYRVVNPWFTPGGSCALPYVHDLHMLGAFPDEWRTARVVKMVDTVVRYVLTEEYQTLPKGFGYGRDDSFSPPRYYVLGWEAGLPGYRGSLERSSRERLILSLEMMAAFSRARNNRWFLESLALLDEHRTDRGSWLLPRAWLPEKRVAYWVAGGHMGLEENRRSRAAIERESTVRVLRVLSRSGRRSDR
jgi:hypothetical protein